MGHRRNKNNERRKEKEGSISNESSRRREM
jgi:hypothetical protein